MRHKIPNFETLCCAWGHPAHPMHMPMVEIMTYFRVMLSSDLCQDNTCYELPFHHFLHSLQVNASVAPRIRQRQICFMSFRIHYSLLRLPFHARLSDLYVIYS
jgi:hypothetical protein